MTEKKLGNKTVDEFIEEIERDLKKLDQKIETQGKRIREDVEGFEKKFKDFMDDPNIDVEELKQKTSDEMKRIKKELEHTAKTLKAAVNYFRAQHKQRD